jgi:C4-dicarboxylate-specific signal transduction histidine kinase
LNYAFEPFWTSDTDALGLGLTQAKALLEGQGAAIRLGNREKGGGEVVISIRREA